MGEMAGDTREVVAEAVGYILTLRVWHSWAWLKCLGLDGMAVRVGEEGEGAQPHMTTTPAAVSRVNTGLRAQVHTDLAAQHPCPDLKTEQMACTRPSRRTSISPFPISRPRGTRPRTPFNNTSCPPMRSHSLSARRRRRAHRVLAD